MIIDNLKVVNSGHKVGREYLWRIYERGLFFFPLFYTCGIWARTAEEAVKFFRHGSGND